MINATTAAILGLLHEAPMTGSELNRMADKWLRPYFSITRSQVYRELDSLAERGLVKSGTPGSRGATPFKITAAGKREFQSWLKETPAEDTLRNQVALRLAFGGLHRGDGLRDMVEWAKNYHEAKLLEAQRLLTEAEEATAYHDVAALHFAEVYHKGNLAWLNSIQFTED